MVFNASKSKCVTCRHRGAVRNNTDRSVEKMSFEICGNAIEVATSWPHIGHIISDDCDDRLDILNRRCSFIGQANNLICVFGSAGLTHKHTTRTRRAPSGKGHQAKVGKEIMK